MKKQLTNRCLGALYAYAKKNLLKLKISTLLILVSSMSLFAGSSYSQHTKLSLDMNDVTIEQVLTSIEKQSEFYFLYSKKIIDVDKVVSLKADKKGVEEILKSIFNKGEITYTIRDKVIVLTTPELAGINVYELLQEITVTGTVTDVGGVPLPGVNITEVGTENGVITDLSGKYTISVSSQSAVLMYSYIGYMSERVELNGKTGIDITLIEDIQSLDEVVVIGYGVQKRSDITGSVTSVGEERLEKLPVTNVMQAVQGAVSGVNITQTTSIPGQGPQILVRGGGSLTAKTDPYVVVDGIPISKIGGSINDISPNDIKSIEILKDASATAIYGMNGANGVILITTKRGDSSKPTIRYSGYTGFEGFARRPEMVSPEELLARYAEGNRINGSVLYGAPLKYEYEIENYENGHIIDWIDEVSQTGVQQNHNLSFSGGTDKLNYYVSGDVLKQKGVVKGYNYKRYSLRTNIDAQVADFLKLGTNTSIISHNSDGGRANLLNAEAMSPYGRMFEEDGSYTIYPMFGETLWANPMLGTTTDPERRQYNVNLNGNAVVTFGDLFQPLKGLTYTLNAGYSYIPVRNSSYTGVSVNDLLGTATIYHSETQAYSIENILRYDLDVNKHHVDLTGVYASQERNYNKSDSRASDFVNDELKWNRMEAGASFSISSYADRYAALSQMGRVNYSYDSKYLFTFTVRRDGSSVFSDDLKYGTFPSVALGWNLHNENFMKNAEAIYNLKLRLSYGKSGNEGVGVYKTFTTMSDVQIPFGGGTNIAMITSQLGNAALTWETKQSLNFGIDFGLYSNRINGSIDMYKANNIDLLLSRNLPSASGFSSVTANIGETESKGIELTVNSVNVQSNNFKWNSTAVFSTAQTSIVELYGDGEDDLGSGWFIGEPIGVIRDYEKVGIWQEDEIANEEHLDWDPVAKAGDVKLADVSGPEGVPDGVITDDDRVILGQTAPKWTGGITNTFTYKNLSLNVFIQTIQGSMRNNSHIGMAADELERRNSIAEVKYWTPENKSNEWRSLSKNSNPHGYRFPVKNNYTRIKDVTLNYELPQKTLDRAGIEGLSVYISGRNLYTFTDWIGWDPEERDVQRGSNDWELNYPSVRTVVFGINVTL